MDERKISIIKSHVKNLLDKMMVDYDFSLEEKDDFIYINIETEDHGLLIGWHGETLNSLEHLIKIILQKEFSFDQTLPKISLDIAGYRKIQNEKIKEIARNIAQKVLKYKQAEVLRPMNAYERRMVHVALKEMDQILTESIGDEPNRRIVIKVK